MKIDAVVKNIFFNFLCYTSISQWKKTKEKSLQWEQMLQIQIFFFWECETWLKDFKIEWSSRLNESAFPFDFIMSIKSWLFFMCVKRRTWHDRLISR